MPAILDICLSAERTRREDGQAHEKSVACAARNNVVAEGEPVLRACAEISETPLPIALRETNGKHRIENATAASKIIEVGILVAEVM